MFKIGDPVALKHGVSRTMVVRRFSHYNDTVETFWLDTDGVPRSAWLPPALLRDISGDYGY